MDKFYKFNYGQTIKAFQVKSINEIEGSFAESKKFIIGIRDENNVIHFINLNQEMKNIVNSMKRSNLKICPELKPEVAIVRGTGPDVRFKLISNFTPGFTQGLGDCDILFVPDLYDQVKDMNLDEFHGKFVDIYDIILAFVHEVNIRNEKDPKKRLAMAYLMVKEYEDIANGTTHDSAQFGNTFYREYDEKIEDFIKENKISVDDTKNLRFKRDFLHKMYNDLLDENTPGSIFIQCIHVTSSVDEFSVLRSILRIQEPKNVKQNLWNAMCLFRSFLTHLEYEKMMIEFFAMLSDDVLDLDQISYKICDNWTPWGIKHRSEVDITDNHSLTFNKIEKKISNLFPAPTYIE